MKRCSGLTEIANSIKERIAFNKNSLAEELSSFTSVERT